MNYNNLKTYNKFKVTIVFIINKICFIIPKGVKHPK